MTALKSPRRQAKMAGSKGPTVRPASEPDHSTYLGRVAARLKDLRVTAGIDHERAAKAITAAGYEVTTSTIYRWEQGKTQPHIEALPAIAKAYGVSARTVLPVS